MLTLRLLMKFIAILNKDASPRQIAGGIALGALTGITPFFSLHNLLVLFLVVMLQVSLMSALLGAVAFSAIGYLLDPVSNSIGYYLLVDAEFLRPIWIALYNTPVVPWTRFNNTLTLGSLVLGIVLFWPFYRLLIWIVVKYREKFMARVQKWRIVALFKGSKIFSLYRKFSI